MSQFEYFILIIGWLSVAAGTMTYGIRPWDSSRSNGWIYFTGSAILVVPLVLGASWRIAGTFS